MLTSRAYGILIGSFLKYHGANSQPYNSKSVSRDLVAGVVVFLVAMPLSMGIALASGATPFAGIIAGIVGGVVVGLISGSHTSVSGPAAGLTSIVAVQLSSLQDFRIFLFAVIVAGFVQLGLGILKAGLLSSFIPSSVIKGLLAAVGIILILKQLPHVLGHDTDPEGEMAFEQPDHKNTFTELLTLFEGEVQLGALVIGLLSLGLLIGWDRIKFLKNSIIPAPLIVVLLGVTLQRAFQQLGGQWVIEETHLVQVPVGESLGQFFGFFQSPDWSQWSNPLVYRAGLLIAIVASLETLINLEAVDRLDPYQRQSPPNRELCAQGIGNVLSGLIGGIPITSVVVRSSVNINAGAKSRISTVFHGVLLFVLVLWLPAVLNMIPISCLAAILIVTGYKLAGPTLFVQMWREGRYQFLPFLLTLIAIVFSDLLYGVLIGMAISLAFILNSNLRRPIRTTIEKHVGDEVIHIELANQVSFLNRASLESVLRGIKRGQHVLLNASHTDYIDPDILSLIRDFKCETAPVLGIQVSIKGFRDKYLLEDEIHYVDYSTKELQELLTATQVLKLLKEGNERFQKGMRLTRDMVRQIDSSGKGQNPLAVVLSCIDSRSPAEIIFDLGLGDIFSVRIAGNVVSHKVLGSIEYGVAVAGAKLIVVLGHTMCGAVTASVNLACTRKNAADATGCQHLDSIVADVQESIDYEDCLLLANASEEVRSEYIDRVTRANVCHSVDEITRSSDTIRKLVTEGKILLVGAIYDVTSGKIEFFDS